MSAAEYDALIYPGFLRRNVARWNDDGSAAPLSRSKGPRNETFVLQLRSGEIDQDVSAIEGEVRRRDRPRPRATTTTRRDATRKVLGARSTKTLTGTRVPRERRRAARISAQRVEGRAQGTRERERGVMARATSASARERTTREAARRAKTFEFEIARRRRRFEDARDDRRDEIARSVDFVNYFRGLETCGARARRAASSGPRRRGSARRQSAPRRHAPARRASRARRAFARVRRGLGVVGRRRRRARALDRAESSRETLEAVGCGDSTDVF
jgi:hypothetical protein